MILDEPSRHRNRIGIRVGHWALGIGSRLSTPGRLCVYLPGSFLSHSLRWFWADLSVFVGLGLCDSA